MGSPSIYGSGYARLSRHAPPGCCTRVWHYANRMVTYVKAAVSKPSEYVAKLIANAFFFPLTSQSKQAQLRKEEGFRAQFWRGEEVPPLDNEKILAAFKQPFDRPYTTTLTHGKQVTLTCSVIESRPDLVEGPQEPPPFYNLVFVAGNHSTNQSEIAGVYPYLDSFLNKRREQEVPSQGRVIVITGYNITDEEGEVYYPKTLDEAGLILKETLSAMQKDFGAIDQIVGHSLGGIILGAAMKHFTTASLTFVPKNILWDRCPHSIYGACKNVNFLCIPVGRILHPLAKWLGWSLDLAEEISQFCTRHKAFVIDNNISFLVNDTLQDHRFHDQQLGTAQKIKDLMKDGFASIIQFDLTQQLFHEDAHHRLIASFCYGAYVINGNKKLLEKRETLADGVMKISLLKTAKVFEGKMQRAA